MGAAARAAALAVLALAALALAVPERAQAQTLEDRLPSGDCRDLNEYPNCGIGLSIDQRAGGYSDGGAIQSAGDGDLWTVVLYRAQSYLIEVKGAGDPGGDNGGTLPDPWVEIYELTYDMGTRRFDPTLRASNDNVNATNKNAGVVYTYPPGTTPQTPIGIRVSGANGARGSYTVSVKGLEGLALTETADCAGDETTACTIEVGGTVRGAVSPSSDDDAWAIPLEEGKTYRFDARGVDSGGGTLPDPSLDLNVVAGGTYRTSAFDNDGGTGVDARIEHLIRAGLGDTYYIEVFAKANTAGGTYTLTVTDISPPLVPPGMPRSLMAAPGDGEVVLTWLAPTNLGGGPLEGYDYRHAAGTSVPSDTPWVSAEDALTATVTSLDNGTAYAFEVRAVNAAGAGDAATATATLLTETTDCAGGIHTTCTIDVGGTESGQVEAGDVNDFWGVTLTAGRTYQFDVKGAGDEGGDNGGTLPDPRGILFDSTEAAVAANDDVSATNKNARFTYMVPDGMGGKFFLAVRVGTGDPGTYTITVTDITPQTQQEAPPAPPAAPLTAEFRNLPAEHDGSSAFTFELHFSEAPKGLSYSTLRGNAFFDVSNGTVTKAKRLVKKDNSGWRVTVEPASDADVTIGFLPALPADDCTEAAVVCTADGTRLSVGAATFVPGPASFSVADATVREGPNATLDFVVSLSRARHEATTVDYATSDGTATAGSDYTADSGTLSFNAGETEKTVSVEVLDDSHDEGSETLTLTLSNPAPSATAKLGDATATGTIENSDPMPQAWLARFGRTVAGHVLDGVAERMKAPRSAGVSATLGGQALPGMSVSGDGEARPPAHAETREAEVRARTLADWLNGERRDDGDAARGIGSRTVTGRELALGSSFSLTGETAGGGTAALWGRGAVSGFDGREGELILDGEVSTGLLGADFANGRWLLGLIASHSRGEGSYRGAGAGTVSSTLTGVHPWARYAMSERFSVWGAAGYGAGTLTLDPDGEDAGERAMQAGLTLALAALGARGELLEPPGDAGGPGLALVSDAMFVRTESESTRGLAAASADVTRLRLALDGWWRFALAQDVALTPSLELGVRHDGGDAETGFGVDIGGGLAFADLGRGLSMELNARTLLAHEASGFRERGLTAALSFDPRPSTDRGLTLSLRQTLGAASTGGADALLGRETLTGLGASDSSDARRLELTAGYGIAMFGGRFTGTPELGVGLSDTGRDYRLGWRLGLGSSGATSFELGLEATRRESANDNADPEHTAGFRIGARW